MSEGEQETGGGFRARLFGRWWSRSEPETEAEATEPAAEPEAAELPAEATEAPEPAEQPGVESSLPETSPAAPRPAADLPELARDVAALWLAFSQHERVLKDLIAEVERIGGRGITAPGGREAPVHGSAAEPIPAPPSGVPQAEASTGTAPTASAIGDQLADLDGILEAIESATKALGQTQSEELNRDEQEPEAGNGSAAEAEHEPTEAEPEDA